MTDDYPADFVCQECGVVLSSVFDYLVHIEVTPEVLINLDERISLNLWSVFEEIYFLADEGNTEEVKALAESIGVTLYSLKTGVLKEQIDELIDYISHVNNNIQKDKQGHFSTFYQLELSAAKNKLKELVA
jgi:uncharacterized protein YlzI (FlbEa/FlbD family)